MNGETAHPDAFVFGPPEAVERAVAPTAHARASDPSTSHEAARSVGSIRESQEAVLRALRARGPCTDEEWMRYYAKRQAEVGYERFPKQSDSGLRTRRSELVALGKLEDSGDRVPIGSGRRAIVWKLVEAE